ncbi:MAG: hypothetical protein JW806_02225 [Sedimentisphaerales bacterium]|nr:hypothetical protein [Sedimentisphaerales bacterium]
MNKKSRNIIIAAVAIGVFVFFMILINMKSELARQLQGPIEGTEKVFTINDKLFVVSKRKHVFTWQWSDLSIWPTVAKLTATTIVPFTNDRIVYYSASGPNRLLLTDLKATKELGGLPLPYGSKCEKVIVSSDGRFGLASMLVNKGMQENVFKLAVFDHDFKELFYVFQKDTASEDFLLYDFAVTGSDGLVAGAGEKDNAWVFISDVNSQEVLWEKTFDEYGGFTSVEFSPNGKQLFAAEKVRHILMFDAPSGQLLKTFVMNEYRTPAHQKQNISAIAISPDGKILAADTEPAGIVWFWEISSGEKIGQIYASELTVSDIAFSPDSKYLATGCLVSPEIKIWKVPHKE